MMADDTEGLIARLVSDLTPRRAMHRPIWRIATWLGLVVAMALWIASGVDLGAVGGRLATTPDMWLAVVGSVLTAIAAAIATFMVSLPDRPARWAWLPVPPLLLWLGANGIGCLRQAGAAGLHPATLVQATTECMPFILRASLPLIVAVVLLLWRIRPLRVELTMLMAGLATAAAAASLLWLDHPFDAGLLDFLVHTAVVAAVVGALRLVGPYVLRRRGDFVP